MKKVIFLLTIVPVLTFAQTRKQKKAQEKADKVTLANVQAHIKYLADDKLQGRRAGTEGERLAMEYIAAQFAKYGLEPKGTQQFIQAFEINEGKQLADSANSFAINGAKLQLKQDYYPLAFSASKSITGVASPGLREKANPGLWM